MNAVLAIKQWLSDINQATTSFMNVAEVVIHKIYDLVINIDTWFNSCFLAGALHYDQLNVYFIHE